MTLSEEVATGPAPMVLSVVVPCLDAAAHLPAFFDALSRESPPGPWEVVIADNGSTDGTRAVAEQHAAELPVRVVDASGRSGQWHARNVGVSEARGAAVVFLDSDDLFSPGYLRTMTEALQSADIVTARIDVRTLNPGWVGESRSITLVDGLVDSFGWLPYASSGCLGIRRQTFLDLGGFHDVRVGEDVDFSWRAQLAGRQIRFVPEAVLYYRFRDTLPGIFRQARWYGRAQPLLYRRFRDAGMPPRPLRRSFGDWWGILVQLAYTRDRGTLASVVFLVGVYVGRAQGSVRYRVLYF